MGSPVDQLGSHFTLNATSLSCNHLIWSIYNVRRFHPKLVRIDSRLLVMVLLLLLWWAWSKLTYLHNMADLPRSVDVLARSRLDEKVLSVVFVIVIRNMAVLVIIIVSIVYYHWYLRLLIFLKPKLSRTKAAVYVFVGVFLILRSIHNLRLRKLLLFLAQRLLWL